MPDFYHTRKPKKKMVLENEVDWEEKPSFLDMCKSQLDDFFMEMSCYFYTFSRLFENF